MNLQDKASSTALPAKTGVYCLANDRALEWFQMFARSLRHFHPTLPLTLIPYNAEVTRLRQLAPQFQFDLIPEAEAAKFEKLETQIMKMGRHAGMFRKWASFFGPYDEFIFFDADVAITRPLDDLFAAFAKSEFDFLYFDTDITVVYETQHIAEMQAKYHSPGFNAGVFASRKGVVTDELLWRMADQAEANRHLFIPLQVDQPFLNYVFDTLPRRIAHANTVLPELALKPWARVAFQHDVRSDRYLDADGRQMPFVHWAGCGYPTMVRPEIFLKYRTLGMSDGERKQYCRRFNFLRFRVNLKNRLRRFPPAAKLFEWRERQKRR